VKRAGPVLQRAPRPVFVDQSGRRRRLVVFVGVALGLFLVTGLIVLLAGFSGASGLHVPGFPDLGPANGADQGPASAETPEPTEEPATLDGGALDPAPEASTAVEPSTPRRVPTQTPSHPPKPTRT
jgi:hypothetical protein